MPDGGLMVLYLSETYGDAYPTDEEILRTVESVAPFPVPRWEAEPVAERGPSEVVCTKRITAQGNSLVIPVSKEARILGVGRGDDVEVTIRRLRRRTCGRERGGRPRRDGTWMG